MKPNNTRRHQVKLGGIDDHVIPADGTAKSVVDLQWNVEGYWEACWGALEVTAFTVGSGAISSLHWFNPRPNQRWLITERRIDGDTSRISYVTWPAGTPTTILDRRRLDSNDQGTQFLDIGRWVYMLSPVDGITRWDGYKVYPVGFTAAAPPPRVSGPEQDFDHFDKAGIPFGSFGDSPFQRGVGEQPVDPTGAHWVYGYAATIVNDLGQESPLSPIIYIAGVNVLRVDPAEDGRHMIRLQYPRCANHIRAVRIWRTQNMVGVEGPSAGATVYLHSEWTTAAGFDYLDLKGDMELGIAFDPDGTGQIPVGARAMAHWQGRMWLAGMPDASSRLAFSSPLFQEQFPDVNYLPIGSSRTGPIVALHAVPHGLLVFKTGGVYMVKGDGFTGYRVETIDETKGTASPRGIQTVPSVGTFFLDPSSGPQVVIGSLENDQPTKVLPIGAGIRKLWRQQVGLQLEQVVSAYDPARDEVWWQVPEGGDPRQKLGIVLHTLTMQWSTRRDWAIGAMEFYDGRLWIGSWDDDEHPGVFLVTAGVRTRFGENIVGVYTTNPLRLPDDEQFQFAWVEGVGLALGRPTWSLSTRSDRAPEQTAQAEHDPHSLHHTHDREIWGTGRWGIGGGDPKFGDYRDDDPPWTDYEVTRFPVSVRVPFAHEHQIRISSRRIRIAYLDLVIPTHQAVKPKPLERR